MFKINNDQASSTVWFILGLIIAMGSLRYGVGPLESPATGFIPFLAGLAISFFSLMGIVHSTLKNFGGIQWKPIMRGLFWKKALLVLAAMLGYALLLKPLGFFTCTVLFIGFLLRTVRPQRWLIVIAGALGTAVGAYWIFEVCLKTQFPKGPWGL